ncbi:AMP-dependent synthetase/ligase [Actinoalloteichus spitiensis]|uniref:AMP-dependent synthetase/ligase n=1 Tax=Actinoalloteichus spitiensis TaxID=252394 RepID=UPI00037B21ED|nr:long-chain fatty acid--CoA ligase [Actinoalloteichus spitiensis]
MREFSLPSLADDEVSGGLAEIVYQNAEREGDRPVYARKVGTVWRDVTARQFRDEVTSVARGLIADGVQQGDRVALLSRSRYEWALLDFAILAIGAVTVPIYATSSVEQIRWILSDSGATTLIVETAELAATAESVRADLPTLKRVWTIDDGAVEAIVALGADSSDDEVTARRSATPTSATATIIYTSGTTGNPKGCVLTHSNFYAEIDNGIGALPQLFRGENGVEPSTLLFLPTAHVFGRMVHFAVARAAARTAFTPDIAEVSGDLQTFRPTFILSVPHVLEKVYNRAQQKAASEGKGRIFAIAAKTAAQYSKSLDAGRTPLTLRLKHAVFDRLVYAKLRAALGGRLRHVISGGSALGERLSHFYRGIGVQVFEGYGLTETTAAATVNSPERVKLGTVGQPLPGHSVRIADDGEVQVRGPVVFGEYWNAREATSEALRDGWFNTGDLGELDSDGYLRITGRKKEMLVTLGGKNVAPATIEDRVRAHPLISNCLVVGDGRPFIAALITLDPEGFAQWKADRKRQADAKIADLLEDAELLATVQEAVDRGNRAVSRAESVRKFRVLDTDFTIAGGHVTPSLKLRRAAITKDFAAEIEALYAK